MRTKNFARAATVAMAVLMAGSAGAGLAAAAAPPSSVTAGSEVYSEVTAADIANPSFADAGEAAPTAAEIGALATADQAVAWFRNRNGSTEHQGYCERAVRLAWNRSTHHASAIAHWKSSDGARHTTGTPPKGAFVFWNISEYGHVGVADGKGGFWATSVNGKIGHASSVGYFNNYLGWKPGNSN